MQRRRRRSVCAVVVRVSEGRIGGLVVARGARLAMGAEGQVAGATACCVSEVVGVSSGGGGNENEERRDRLG